MAQRQQTRRGDAGSEPSRAGETAIRPPVPATEDLSGTRQVVLVLRLVLDQQARLRRGELLDAEGVGQGRFVSLTGLVATVLRWLERQQSPLPALRKER